MPSTTTPASGIVLVQRHGLGVATKPARDPLGIWRRRRRRNRVEGRQWFSPLAYFQGPYDEAGLKDSGEFFRLTSLNNKPPQVYLTATETGLGIVPIQNRMMRKGRGTQSILWTTYPEIDRIELKPASRSRLSVMTPSTSSELGEVIVTTKTGQVARLTGTSVTEFSEFLQSLGAIVER
jgi:hypothetical protein